MNPETKKLIEEVHKEYWGECKHEFDDCPNMEALQELAEKLEAKQHRHLDEDMCARCVGIVLTTPINGKESMLEQARLKVINELRKMNKP